MFFGEKLFLLERRGVRKCIILHAKHDTLKRPLATVTRDLVESRDA